MHAALAIPEIVDAILRSLALTTRSFLYPCLFVNHIFSTQAVRLLWGSRASGRRLYSFMCLYKNNPVRAQFYANFTQHLQLRRPRSEEDKKCSSVQQHASGDIPRLELPFELGWPLLKAVEFDDARIDLSSVQRFLQPSLLQIKIHSVERISDTLLRCISVTCPKLTQLEINLPVDSKNTFSEQATLDLITRCNSLQSVDFIDLRHLDPTITWTTPVIRALAQLPNLQNLSIGGIRILGWCDIIQEPSKTIYETKAFSIFPNLHSLHTAITLTECRLVFPYLKTIKSLSLHKIRGDTEFQRILVPIAVNFPTLTSLSIFMACRDDQSFSGPEIVFLSQNCTGLQSLRLCAQRTHWFQGDVPSDLNDDLIGEVATNLPRLARLDFDFAGARLLTVKSLEFLSKSCRELWYCRISTDIQWHALASIANKKHDSMRILRFNHLRRTRDRGVPGIVPPSDLEVKEMATNFVSCFPKLMDIQLSNHETNNYFVREVEKIIKERGSVEWGVSRNHGSDFEFL